MPTETLELIPAQGERLEDGRWRCLPNYSLGGATCGWTGPSEELRPRRYEGDTWTTFVCPLCGNLQGIARTK